MAEKRIPETKNQQSELEIIIEEKAPGVLSRVPKEGRNKLVSAIHSLVVQYSYSGPVPPPEILEKYKSSVADGPERIMGMAERQSAHRIRIESLVIGKQQLQSQVGQWMAFVIVLVLAAMAYSLAMNGQTAVAITIFSATIVGVAALFITGKLSMKSDLKEKAKRQPPSRGE